LVGTGRSIWEVGSPPPRNSRNKPTSRIRQITIIIIANRRLSMWTGWHEHCRRKSANTFAAPEDVARQRRLLRPLRMANEKAAGDLCRTTLWIDQVRGVSSAVRGSGRQCWPTAKRRLLAHSGVQKQSALRPPRSSLKIPIRVHPRNPWFKNSALCSLRSVR
jgi:hypothetical protein